MLASKNKMNRIAQNILQFVLAVARKKIKNIMNAKKHATAIINPKISDLFEVSIQGDLLILSTVSERSFEYTRVLSYFWSPRLFKRFWLYLCFQY